MYPQTLVRGHIVVAFVIEIVLLTQRRRHGELAGIGAFRHASGVIPVARDLPNRDRSRLLAS